MTGNIPNATYDAAVMQIAAVHGALPPHRYPQRVITEAFADLVGATGTNRTLLERVHASACIDTRNLVIPLEDYPHIADFGEANDLWITAGVDLGEQAVRRALEIAGIAPEDVDLLVVTSVTGMAAPSVDARLVPRLGLRSDVRRLPLFGLGCVAGAAGIARLHDFLVGRPDGVAVLLAVELCSLTVQRSDSSVANMVASGLFGDGVAAVVAVGAERAARRSSWAGPAVLDSRSRLYPDSERVMGWDIGGSGFKIVLSASVADVVRQYLGDDVRDFLADHELKPVDIDCWVAHPGGPKVLHAMREALELPDGALAVTWQSLASIGNLSSASVLHVLQDTIAARPPGTGEPAVLLAMGPGFCSELVLLRW
jgi:alkylresorcinol/alkylpyrone synthase